MSISTDIAVVKKYVDPGLVAQGSRVAAFINSGTSATANSTETVAVRLITSTANGAIGGAFLGGTLA